MKTHRARKPKPPIRRVMRLCSIQKAHEILVGEGHQISRCDLYRLRHEGKLPLVNGKTSPEAIIAYLERELKIARAELDATDPEYQVVEDKRFRSHKFSKEHMEFAGFQPRKIGS